MRVNWVIPQPTVSFDQTQGTLVYNRAKAGFMDGTEQWGTLTYKLTLLSNNYKSDPDHVYASAFSGAELSGVTFTAGFNGTIRKTLTGVSSVANNTNDFGEARANNVLYSGISAGTIFAAVVLREATSDGLSPLIAYLSGITIETTGTNLLMRWASNVLFRVEDEMTDFESEAFEPEAFE